MTRRARGVTGELLEDPFSAQVRGLADFYGWLGYHTHDSRRSAAGFPDWVFVRGPELLFAELKTDRGRTSPAQRKWLEALELVALAVAAADGIAKEEGFYIGANGADFSDLAVEVHLWRPRDFEAIHARLARGRHRQEPIG